MIAFFPIFMNHGDKKTD